MIKINAAIYGVLVNDPNVSSIVGDKVFPNVVPDKDSRGDNIKYPLIVLNRLSVDPTNTKTAGCSYDSASVEVTCWSESYIECVEIADAVVGCLDWYEGEIGDIKINKCRFAEMNEGFSDMFYQRIVFNLK